MKITASINGKEFEFKIGQVVKCPEEHSVTGEIAYQYINYKISFFGTEVNGEFDTKIYADGRQLVHGGDGFFANGIDISKYLKA